MSDLISRDDAKRIIDDIDTWCAGWRDYAKEQIDNLPSAEPMDDPIRRQDAINALKNVLVSEELEYAIPAIEKLTSAQPDQRWIPCSERLPEVRYKDEQEER